MADNTFVQALAALTREALVEQGATEDLAALDSKPFQAATEDGSTWFIVVDGRDMPARFTEAAVKERAGPTTSDGLPN